MKRGYARTVLAITALCLAGMPLHARDVAMRRALDGSEVDPRPVPGMPSSTETVAVPSIGGLGGSITPEQAQAMASAPEGEPEQVLGPVIQFLELRPGQVEQLLQLLAVRHQTVVPLVQGIVEREQQLRGLLQGDPNPFPVGVLILEIRQLYREIADAQAAFVAAFEAMLDVEQEQRLAAIRLAAELRPLLPTFRGLGLL